MSNRWVWDEECTHFVVKVLNSLNIFFCAGNQLSVSKVHKIPVSFFVFNEPST